MKNWGEIKQSTLDKLFLDESEAEQQGYKAKFRYLANECLNFIANSVKPKVSVFEPIVFAKYVRGKDFHLETIEGVVTLVYTNQCGERVEMIPEKNTPLFDGEVVRKFNGTDLVFVENGFVNDYPIRMPDDFISFADLTNYVDDCADPDVVYIDMNSIVLARPGRYKIYYNALWEEIPEEVDDRYVIKVPTSILNCLPTYMASQLLRQDDIQQSTVLSNQFEVMLSRLDTDMMIQEKHFKSTGGWY